MATDATIPCDDCIDGVNPYNPLNWGYIAEYPSKTVSYNVATNTPAATFCATTGDPNLGIISNSCDYGGRPAPTSVANVPYVLVNQECGSDATQVCLGKTLGMPACGLKSVPNPYGYCTFPTWFHNWFARDWVTEMNLPAPVTTPPNTFSNMKTYCCFLDPNTPNRTAMCPPNLWAGSAQCQAPVAQYCASLGGWDSECDSYVSGNQGSLNGQPFAQGLFLSTLANWSSQFASSPPSGTCSTNSGCPAAPPGWGCQNGQCVYTPPPPTSSDPFMQTILKWAPTYGGLMSASLKQACAGVTKAQIDADATSGLPNAGTLGKVCACYLPPSQYYLPGVIPVECDSLCSLAGGTGGVPVYEWSPSGGLPIPKTCKQTTCVIDQVAINYSKTIAGGVNFSQVCGDCASSSGGGSCTCVANGIDITSISSEIPGVNITQACGSFATANGGIAPAFSVPAKAVSFWDAYKYWIMGGIFLVLAIMAFFLIRKI